MSSGTAAGIRITVPTRIVDILLAVLLAAALRYGTWFQIGEVYIWWVLVHGGELGWLRTREKKMIASPEWQTDGDTTRLQVSSKITPPKRSSRSVVASGYHFKDGSRKPRLNAKDRAGSRTTDEHDGCERDGGKYLQVQSGRAAARKLKDSGTANYQLQVTITPPVLGTDDETNVEDLTAVASAPATASAGWDLASVTDTVSTLVNNTHTEDESSLNDSYSGPLVDESSPVGMGDVREDLDDSDDGDVRFFTTFEGPREENYNFLGLPTTLRHGHGTTSSFSMSRSSLDSLSSLGSGTSQTMFPIPRIDDPPDEKSELSADLTAFVSKIHNLYDSNPYLPTFSRTHIAKFLLSAKLAKGKEEDAVKAFDATIEWRRKNNYEQLFFEDFSDLEATGKLYFHPDGHSQERIWHTAAEKAAWGQKAAAKGRGRGKDVGGKAIAASNTSPASSLAELAQTSRAIPILVWQAARHLMCANQTELARTVRYLVATVEKAKRAHQLSTRVIVVISRLDVQTPNKDPALLRLLLSTFQTHYPCHLEKLYLFPKTMLLTMGWNVAKVFLNTDIRNRICILGEGEWKDVVRKEVGVQGLGDGFVRGDIAGVEAGEDEEPDSREGSRSDVSKT